MAGSPAWKVYDARGQYQASCKEVEAAAALVSFYGIGATIRHGHSSTVWVEGADGNAADSYDDVANVAHIKVRDRAQARANRYAAAAMKYAVEQGRV